MIEVELPDGTILEAPDGSDPSVVAKNYLRQQRVSNVKASNPAEYDPASPEYQAKYGAQTGAGLELRLPWMDKGISIGGGNRMTNFMAGVGKATVDMGRGLKQIALGAADLVSPKGRYDQYERQMDQVKAQDAPLMQTGSGMLGNIAGNIATTLVPASIAAKGAQAVGLTRTGAALSNVVNPTSLKGALAAGGAMGAIQPTGTEDSRLLNTGLGAAGSALGYGVSRAIGRIAQPVQSDTPANISKSAKVLEDAGVPLDAAQKTGSTRLAQVKRFLTDNPLTSQGQQQQWEKTASAFDRAALKTIGETADVADEAVMSRAARRIGNVMDDVASRNPVKVNDSLLTKLGTIENRASSELETSQAGVIKRQVSEILDKGQNGQIDGKAYKAIRESLGRLQGNMDSGVKYWAGQLKDALDDALKVSAPKEDVAALAKARLQWRNMEAIQKVIGSQEGQHISPAKLANALNTKGYGGKVAMVRGRGATDLMKLSKAGSTIIPDRFPNSGTLARAALQLALPGALGAGYGYAKEGDMQGALMYGAGGALAPYGLQRLINTPTGANYLANGLGAPAALTRLPGYLQMLPAAYALKAAGQ